MHYCAICEYHFCFIAAEMDRDKKNHVNSTVYICSEVIEITEYITLAYE